MSCQSTKWSTWFGVAKGKRVWMVIGGVVGRHWEGRDAFGSVGVCDEACRLINNGSKYESG